MVKQDKPRVSWWHTDTLLGTLIVNLTIATAFTTYQRALTDIHGGDLDFEALAERPEVVEAVPDEMEIG